MGTEGGAQRAGLTVRLLGGGLLVGAAQACWVIDPTPRGVEQLTARELGAVQGIILTAGVAQVAAGWLCLLDALGPMRARQDVLTVYPIGDGRLPALVEVWHNGMPGAVRVQLDGVAPEMPIALGPLEVQLCSVRRGEPDWRGQRVVPSPGAAVELRLGPTRLLWIPPVAPGSRVRRLATGADLVVYAVAQGAWPRSEHAWRATWTEALRDTQGAREVWFVDELGRRLDHGPVN